MSFLKSKKADVIFDIIFIVIIIVVLGVSAMLIYPTLVEMKDDVISNPSATADVINVANSTTSNYPTTMDNAVGLAVVLLSIFVLISSWFLDTNPVFFIVSVILMLVVLVAMFFISNSLFDVVSDVQFVSSVNSFPITYWIITHLAHIVLGLFVLVGAVIYAKQNV